jgi:hypothetical protein
MRRTNNVMAKGKETKRHTLIQKSIHNQLKIDPRTNPTKKPGLDSGTPEGLAVGKWKLSFDVKFCSYLPHS